MSWSPPLGREHLRYPVTDANISDIPSRVDSVSGMEVTPELRIAVVCISRHSSCRGVMEFRYAAVARQLASAAASGVAALANASATVAAALATTTSDHVVWVAETRDARPGLTALDGD